MTIAIQNLQTIAPYTDTELLEELNSNQLYGVSGGCLVAAAVLAAGAVTGASLATAAVVGAGVGYYGAQKLNNG